MIKFRSNRDVKVDAKLAEQLILDIQNNPMGGWFDLPENFDQKGLDKIKRAAERIQQDSEILVCIGIGGSYLGHKALIEALGNRSHTQVLYAGNSLSSRAMSQLLKEIGDKDFSLNVISKSGTTTEPAVAFRLLKEKLQQKYGGSANTRIYATTDRAKGALHDEATQNGYTSFVVPDNIGGRYSVLSAVGLLPLVVAGIDVDDLLAGAKTERTEIISDTQNSAAQYAFWRHDLQERNYDVEVLASFEPSFREFEEWWKQLFGESEGKNHQGIFPASVIYTTDLHSLGQYMQDGRRNIFETVLAVENSHDAEILVPAMPENLDGLQYLEGKSLDYINNMARQATIKAHLDGGIPVGEISLPELNAHTFGALVFFFETACALSAMLAHVNPFDQPGVEAYKQNMFHLLGKPGY